MPSWEWAVVVAIVVPLLVAESKVVRWWLGRIARSDNSRRNGSLEAAVADEYLRDPDRLVADVMYFGWGVVLGTVPIWIAILGYVSVGWILFGLGLSIFSFGAVGARAVYGNTRFRSISSFFGDLARRH